MRFSFAIRLAIVLTFAIAPQAYAQRVNGSGVRVNGTSTMYVADGTNAAPGIAFAAQPGVGFYRPSTNTIGMALNSLLYYKWDTTGFFFNVNGSGPYLTNGSTGNELAQQNGTNGQTFNIYNTLSGNNYERGFLKWSSNNFRIGMEANGTGSSRDVYIDGGTSVRFTIGGSETWRMAPNFIATTDNNADIGSGTNAARDVYAARAFVSRGTGLAVANVGANSCGTSAATIAGGNNAFVITVGATSGTQCRVTFTVAAATEWDCAANDDTTTVAVRVTPVDTTHTDFIGTFTAADKVSAVCFPR